MRLTKYTLLCLLSAGCLTVSRAGAADGVVAGPLFSDFPITLGEGRRTEILGPLFYSEQNGTQHQWAVPPLGLSYTSDPDVEAKEYDFVYPLLTYDRFGAEYRWQFFQLFSFAGGNQPASGEARRFTIFPVYFQQRSDNPASNYTALVPFYGHIEHRLFRDQIDFVLWPFYVKTRKKDVITRNMPYPFFHLREGDGLRGWQVWPFMGREHKEVTSQTNGFGEKQIVGGREELSVMWPFFTDSRRDLGTDIPVHEQGFLPFYSFYRSDLRESTSYLWPLGLTHTIDREQKYEEWDAPWPFVEFAHGEGKTTRRIWPFFSQAHNQSLEGNWYLWPIYKYEREVSDPLDRARTRILFWLYSDTIVKNTETGKASRRVDFLPLYTWERDFNGAGRFQFISVIEPFFPYSKSIARDYSPLFALWRSEWNPKTGAASQSLLWNLWRRETRPQVKNISLLFGLFQYQSSPDGARWRVCYVPFGGKKRAPSSPPNP